jgi:Flp pilus assembly protein TadG
MIQRLKRLTADQSGASAVEFAMVMPFLIVMLVGVFEFARVEWTREALQETASAGARCMAMNSTSCATAVGGSYSSANTQTFIENTATNWGLTLTASNITLNNNNTCAGITSTNGFSTVALNYTFVSIVPSLTAMLKDNNNDFLGGSSGEALTASACFPNY